MAQQQMSMFNEVVTDNEPRLDVSTITWSYSRRNIFEQCNLRFYLDYYGSHKRRAYGEPNKDRIRILKNLQPRYLYAGSLLHRVIQSYFNNRNRNNVWGTASMIDWTLERVMESRSQSRQVAPDTPISEDQKILMEYYYQYPDVEELYDEIEERLTKALSNFAESPVFEEFRQMGLTSQAHVERRFTLHDILPCKVTGQIDLAYELDNKIVIIDWKFGDEDNIGRDSLQLAAYALWAIDEFRCTVNDIRLFKAFLGSNQLKEFQLTEENLQNAKGRIRQDAEILTMYHSYGKEGKRIAFSPCSQPQICKLCQYRGLCYA